MGQKSRTLDTQVDSKKGSSEDGNSWDCWSPLLQTRRPESGSYAVPMLPGPLRATSSSGMQMEGQPVLLHRAWRRVKEQFNSSPATILLPVFVIFFIALHTITRFLSVDHRKRSIFNEKVHNLSATKLVEVLFPQSPLPGPIVLSHLACL